MQQQETFRSLDDLPLTRVGDGRRPFRYLLRPFRSVHRHLPQLIELVQEIWLSPFFHIIQPCLLGFLWYGFPSMLPSCTPDASSPVFPRVICPKYFSFVTFDISSLSRLIHLVLIYSSYVFARKFRVVSANNAFQKLHSCSIRFLECPGLCPLLVFHYFAFMYVTFPNVLNGCCSTSCHCNTDFNFLWTIFCTICRFIWSQIYKG